MTIDVESLTAAAKLLADAIDGFGKNMLISAAIVAVGICWAAFIGRNR